MPRPRRQPLPDTSAQGPYPGYNLYAGGGPTSVMPPIDMGGDPGGYQPVDAGGYPINPGYGAPSPTPTPSPYQPPSLEITGDTPSPSSGLPSNGGKDIAGFGGDTTIPGSLGYVPDAGYNYYDAGNGITYVYDSDWNYIYTSNGTQPSSPANQPPQYATSAPSSPYNSPGRGFDPNAGFTGQPVTGAGPYSGGNQNPNNPGYVAPGVGPQQVLSGSDAPGAAITTLFSRGQHNI